VLGFVFRVIAGLTRNLPPVIAGLTRNLPPVIAGLTRNLPPVIAGLTRNPSSALHRFRNRAWLIPSSARCLCRHCGLDPQSVR